MTKIRKNPCFCPCHPEMEKFQSIYVKCSHCLPSPPDGENHSIVYLDEKIWGFDVITDEALSPDEAYLVTNKGKVRIEPQSQQGIIDYGDLGERNRKAEDLESLILDLLNEQQAKTRKDTLEEVIDILERSLEATEIGYGKKADVYKSGFLNLDIIKDLIK